MKIQPPRHAPDSEQKFMVLYCLARLGPCTELQLLQFLVENDLLNYFEMMFALNDLCSGGQAARTKKNTGFLYEATDAGREALELFGGRVPMRLKTLISDTETEWKQRFREETQYRQQIEQTGRGDYDLTLRIVEQEMDMMVRFVSVHGGMTAPQAPIMVYWSATAAIATFLQRVSPSALS